MLFASWRNEKTDLVDIDLELLYNQLTTVIESNRAPYFTEITRMGRSVDDIFDGIEKKLEAEASEEDIRTTNN